MVSVRDGSIPCFSCKEPVHCCTEEYPDQNMIMITFHDAKRICDSTGLRISDFAEFRRVGDSRRAELDDDEKYYLVDDKGLFMKKVRNKCVFLGKDYLCTIHAFRPRLCRMYPFWYEEDDGCFKIIRMNDRSSDSCPVTKGCRRIGNPCFGRVAESRDSLLSVAKEYDFELREYQRYKARMLEEPLDGLFSQFFRS